MLTEASCLRERDGPELTQPFHWFRSQESEHSLFSGARRDTPAIAGRTPALFRVGPQRKSATKWDRFCEGRGRRRCPFERKTAKNGQSFFVWKGGNGKTIRKSEMYSSETAVEHGIASVEKCARCQRGRQNSQLITGSGIDFTKALCDDAGDLLRAPRVMPNCRSNSCTPRRHCSRLVDAGKLESGL